MYGKGRTFQICMGICASPIEGGCQYHRMDILWAHLSSMKSPDGMDRFPCLAKVAQLVLVLPQSDAEEESF